ncbi:MAG: hypothetical protein ACE5E6_01345, partial [Phycisphaerae bacterium]
MSKEPTRAEVIQARDAAVSCVDAIYVEALKAFAACRGVLESDGGDCGASIVKYERAFEGCFARFKPKLDA